MKQELIKLGGDLLTKAKDNSPRLMSFGAVAGLGLTVFFALRAKPKVEEHIAEAKGKIEDIINEKGAEAGKEEIKKVKQKAVKDVTIDVLPALTSGVITTSLILGADKVNADRTAGALALADICDRNQKRYQEATKEIVGEKKEEEIRERAATKFVEESYNDNVPIFNTGKGNVVYVDTWTTTYFRSSRTAIDAAVNEINKRFQYRDEYYISLNDFRRELGLPPVKFGEQNGFCAAESGPLEVYFTVAEMPDGNHCIALEYDISKKYKDTNHIER